MAIATSPSLSLLSDCRITAILVSRFLLELQEAHRTVVRVDADDPLHFSYGAYDDTPSFIRSLGSAIDTELRLSLGAERFGA